MKQYIQQKNYRIVLSVFFIATSLLSSPTQAMSQCYGTVSKGRIEGSVKLPTSGKNFSPYSQIGTTVGRTYVHSEVAEIITAAYSELAKSNPSAHYVYGETGWASGGRIRPHRTHQNGLSVDFFVPVKDETGKSVPLPTGLSNRLGYEIEFDKNAKYSNYDIDFSSIAEHMYQLNIAAKTRGYGIALVIFDPAFLAKLFATSRGNYLKQNLPFMKGQAWVRHDEHYHVDFAISCKPIDIKSIN
jgi:penicillin-insensitive murein DD-endopeptidase